MVVMGVMAVRLQDLKRVLEWDGERMEFTNISSNDKVKVVSKDEFEVTDGHPKINREHIELNALDFSKELIQHTYRNGWDLPDMPS